MVTARLPRVPRQLALQGVIPDTGPEDKSSSRIPKRKPGRSRAISAGGPHHSELELRCGVPYGLGGVPEAGGVRSSVNGQPDPGSACSPGMIHPSPPHRQIKSLAPAARRACPVRVGLVDEYPHRS